MKTQVYLFVISTIALKIEYLNRAKQELDNESKANRSADGPSP
jgi:hypothetical protein